MTITDIAGLCERLRRKAGFKDPVTIEYVDFPINYDGPEAADTLERQAAERDALRLAILGGEDVPGVAATVSIDQCIRFLTEERQRNEWSAEQQAKLERQAAEIERLRGALWPFTTTKPTAAKGFVNICALNVDVIAARAALTGEDPCTS